MFFFNPLLLNVTGGFNLLSALMFRRDTSHPYTFIRVNPLIGCAPVLTCYVATENNWSYCGSSSLAVTGQNAFHFRHNEIFCGSTI
uniref:Secreted protein n=1 Tax=Panagrellus redivivus TaxID=6233 RepID=A0A7E4UM70_PANRE